MLQTRDPEWCRDQAQRFRKKAEQCGDAEDELCRSYSRVAEAYEELARTLEQARRT